MCFRELYMMNNAWLPNTRLRMRTKTALLNRQPPSYPMIMVTYKLIHLVEMMSG